MKKYVGILSTVLMISSVYGAQEKQKVRKVKSLTLASSQKVKLDKLRPSTAYVESPRCIGPQHSDSPREVLEGQYNKAFTDLQKAFSDSDNESVDEAVTHLLGVREKAISSGLIEHR